MEVGILGATGPAGSGLAVRLASVGIDVVVGSRSKERAQETCTALLERWPGRGLSLSPADNGVAAEAEVVVVATPWEAAAATAHSVAPQLDGKVVISMANALTRMGHGEFEPLVPPRGSVAAHVQSSVPGSLVAAAFHHLPAKALASLDVPARTTRRPTRRRPGWSSSSPTCGRSTPGRCPTRGPSRPSPPCSSSSTSATRPGRRCA
jgi:8-hydroxy-5-deazaflavin:NADPH oxidoreductase